MASEIDICKLALSHLGDRATINSIAPPDGSAQAAYCATYYPMARDSLLEMHQWAFATKRAALAQLDNPASQWVYCYAAPQDVITPISVIYAEATDDLVLAGAAVPQPYSFETLDSGQQVIYTNQENALLRYVARVRDTTKFSPLFTTALAAYLASMLAGPIIKGDQGISVAAKWLAITFGQDGRGGLFGRAASSDAGKVSTNPAARDLGGWQR